tara:strand:+ start:2533 stop:3369 length:837 start_codon:yes stop_codon:yes gene_type:complete
MATELDWKNLEFPMETGGFATKDMVPLWLNFKAVEYETKTILRNNVNREKAPNDADVLADISLPMPKNIESNNSINYSTETENRGFDATAAGFGQAVNTLGGTTTLLKDVTGYSGLYGRRPMDERASIFKGASMRQHNYDWLLVPKGPGDGEMIANIAKCFQTLAYPRRFGHEVRTKVIHPLVWHIVALDTRNEGGGAKFRWDLGPLASVISNVKIQSAGAAGGLYLQGNPYDAYPAATRISITFTELEPAINVGKDLQSRSSATSHAGDNKSSHGGI